MHHTLHTCMHHAHKSIGAISVVASQQGLLGNAFIVFIIIIVPSQNIFEISFFSFFLHFPTNYVKTELMICYLCHYTGCLDDDHVLLFLSSCSGCFCFAILLSHPASLLPPPFATIFQNLAQYSGKTIICK